MIKSAIDDKTKLICDKCGYEREFTTFADAVTYLAGRGRLYGWLPVYFNDNEHICPFCSTSPDEDTEEPLDPYTDGYILQMRLEMFP